MIKALKVYFSTRLQGEHGVTTVEYAIMLALVAIAVATATPSISSAVKQVFTDAIAIL